MMDLRVWRKLKGRQQEVKELRRYYAEQLAEREAVLALLDAAIQNHERGSE